MTDLASRRVVPPTPDSYGSIVHQLERVELQARERRLAAESEADRIRTAAHATAGEINAGVPGRIAAALAELRARHLDAAEAEVAAIDASLADEPVQGDGSIAGPVPDAAVELLVAAVLAEPATKRAS